MLKQGLAKSLFAEAYQRLPWLSNGELQTSVWPFLDLLFTQKRLTYLDYILTHRLLRNYPDIGQEVALFLCHLTLAAKEGHLCVYVNQGELYPSVLHLWKNDEGYPLAVEEGHLLTQLMIEGMHKIPSDLICAVNPTCPSIPYQPICREGNHFYLQRNWIFETLFLKFLKQHLNQSPFLNLPIHAIKVSVDHLCQNKLLLPEQAQAIVQGCLNSLTLVTGGPGTGKTYTVGYLIKIFWENLSKEQRKLCQIILAAPTGKAAANLQRSLNKVISTLEDFPLIQAKTLHSLLGIKPNFYEESYQLSADLIVVDESSMIDVKMMACLFKSLKRGSRLILLGDQHQLPSVEAGSVFVDLINLQCSHPHLMIPCTHLSMCLRAELKSLIDFAQLINQGLAQEVLDYLNQSSGIGIKRLHLSNDKKEAQREFFKYIIPSLTATHRSGQSIEQYLEFFQTIRLLSPMRKGPFGVESLNQIIWQQVSQLAPKIGYLAIPIMIVTNDYRQELFNGETGVLIRRLPLQSIGIEDYALFPARQMNGQVRRLSALLLPKYEYAYCLSVHKSQGSEFDRVILVLPEGSELFGREVFYTAITRARKQIEIYGSDTVILKTVMQRGIRLSGIEQRLTTK